MSDQRVKISEEEIEGVEKMFGLSGSEKEALLGGDEEMYEGLLRASDCMARNCKQEEIMTFKEKLAGLFPHDIVGRQSYTVNCRLLIRQSYKVAGIAILTYKFYVLLYKRFLLYFSHVSVTPYVVKEMIGVIREFKEEYKKNSRASAQIDFFLSQLESPPARGAIEISYDFKENTEKNKQTLFSTIAKVRVGSEQKTFACQRTHPSMALFAAQSEVLAYLKSLSLKE